MRLFQKRWMAWIVLILAIAAAVGLGQLRRPANRGYDKYIDDRADLFSAKARQTLRDCNARWDSTYGVRLAVATLPGAPGQDLEDYGYRWGNDNGLTEWDMVLVLTADDWTVCPGDEIWEYLNDTYQTRLSAAVNGAKDDDEVVSRFCAALDDFYGHALRRTAANTAQKSAFPWGRVILVLLAVAVIWVLVDRARYRRYRRSVAALPTGATPVRRTTPYYYPVFWGRRTAPPRPPRPPRRPAGSTYRPAPQRQPRPMKPARPATLQPGKTYRPSGGTSFRPGSGKTSHSFGASGGHSFGGSHSGFGGSRSTSGSRSSSVSRSSSGSRSFSSGRSSSGSRSFGGSRGGGKSFGGKR